MPFGFQSTALGAYLRLHGASLTQVGLASALSLPWMLKALWAPLVDRHGSMRFGRRKSWIVPLQGLLALTCIAAGLLHPETQLKELLALVFLMNLFAATQDIAVDALAVDLLGERDLGLGNTAQVVGYKVGMLTGGGLLVWASAQVGWSGLFWAMGGLCLAVMGATFFFRESTATAAGASAPPQFREVGARLLGVARQPGTFWLVVFVATYKLGESMADKMYTPFLIDHGNTPAQVGLWLGTWGMLASLAGSTFGGVMATRLKLLDAVVASAVLRVFPLALQWAQTAGLLPIDAAWVVGVNCTEHFFAGALTTAMFAFLMSRVDRRIGGTHYTVLASVEVAGKSVTTLLSGVFADWLGYSGVFLLAVGVSVLYPLTVVPLKRTLAPAPVTG